MTKFVDDLVANKEYATKKISRLDPDNTFLVQRKEWVERRLREHPKPSAKYQGADVYFFGDAQQGYAVLAKHEEVLYFVRHELIKHNKLQLGRQVIVWRNKEVYSGASAGFASKIFFEYLLPKYKALVADKEQSPDGYTFWHYALREAFSRNKFVYFLNRRSTPNTLTRLHTYEDVLEHEHDLWGEEDGHLRTFAVISEIPLAIKHG